MIAIGAASPPSAPTGAPPGQPAFPLSQQFSPLRVTRGNWWRRAARAAFLLWAWRRCPTLGGIEEDLRERVLVAVEDEGLEDGARGKGHPSRDVQGQEDS